MTRFAIVLGDLLFNVRSALDHIAVACAPLARKRQAGFPIYERLNDEEQRKFESMTRDMAPEAVAAIEYVQPYNVANRTSRINPESVEALFALNALQDADKHRSLAVLVGGISHPRVQVSGGGEVFRDFQALICGATWGTDQLRGVRQSHPVRPGERGGAGRAPRGRQRKSARRL